MSPRPRMWRAVFDSGSALIVAGETREDARLQAAAYAWLLTGQWLPVRRVEAFSG